jgi:polyhydroxyalkanoate synthesis repressor PhaR
MTDNTQLKKLEIRKYPNRRYYDVTRSRHLTLEDIRGLVRDGHDIRVTDSKTSADITAKVLAQIILELDAEKIEVFPVALLMRLIRVNDRLVQDFMERYFDQAVGAFIQYRRQFEEQLRGGEGLGALYSPFANWNRAVFNPFGMPAAGGAVGSPLAADAGGNAGPGPKDLQEKINVLEQKLANVQAKLGGRNRGGRAKGRRTKAKKG